MGTIVKKERKPCIDKAEELRQSAAAFAIELTGASADGEQSGGVRLRSSVKAEAGSGAASKRRRAEAEAEEADQAEEAAQALTQLAGQAAEDVPAASRMRSEGDPYSAASSTRKSTRPQCFALISFATSRVCGVDTFSMEKLA